MNSFDFFIYEFICFMNSYMYSGVPRFQMVFKDGKRAPPAAQQDIVAAVTTGHSSPVSGNLQSVGQC